MATSRQRFLDALEFKNVNPRWMRTSGAWQETLDIWRTQGYEGQPLDQYFGVDRIVRVDPYYGPVPEFEHTVIEEDDRTITYINHEGILMRELKQHRDTSMPQFIKFPVESAADFEKLRAERLVLNLEQRLSPEWRAHVAAGGVAGRVNEDLMRSESLYKGAPVQDVPPRQCWADRWGGYFGSIRNMMGVENLCRAFYDQPKLLEHMMEERTEAMIAITEKVLEVTNFDVFWFWEDMAYKTAPLVGTAMFRKFAFHHYRRVVERMHSHGIKHIGLDSDGNIDLLLPIWIEAGIDHIWPFEVQAGMDVNQVRAKYGHSLALLGGIDKRCVALGGETMRREVERVMPVVEDGGYIPELDHSAPPDISWPDYCAYIEYLKFRLGRG
ncbi:MAG: Uroporphyrinogen deCOase protein [Chloroflexota bacterium]|nr:Uroporphyrinogen deCOase protein [Chloroflexota bacterium]